MMSKMRENMPLIMWILVGAFLATIVFSWGMGGFSTKGALDGVVGRVGGREIMYDQYNRRVQDRIAQKRQQDSTAKIDDATIRQVRRDVWDEMVRNELMSAYQEKLGLETSDEEVAFAVRNSPPTWLRDNEAFKRDGMFDPSKYEEFLKDPRSAEVLVAIEKDYRASMGNQKVIDRVLAPIYVTDAEAWDEYLATTRRFKAAVVQFPLRNFLVDSNSISSSEIQDYYTKNHAEFKREERRKLSYVTVLVTMTKEDTNRVLELAQETLSRVNAGEDFAALAKEYSEDEGSAVNGGDLGYFTRGRMVKEFDSTAFATEPGKVVGPIQTRFGLHIIKVFDHKGSPPGDSVRASHILLKWKVSSDTDERAAQRAKDFADAAKADGFEKAASHAGLEVKQTDWFARTPAANVPGFGALPAVVDFAFESKKGALSYVIRTKVRNDDAYSVFMVSDIAPAGQATLAEVESQIRGTLLKKKQEQMALEAARRFRMRSNTPETFLAEAARESLKIDTTGEHLQRDFLRVFGSDEKIAKTMFSLDPGQVSEPLSNSRGAYVAVLLSKSEVDTAGYRARKQEIVDQLRRTKQNSAYADWLALAKESVGVEDRRYLYYTDY